MNTGMMAVGGRALGKQVVRERRVSLELAGFGREALESQVRRLRMSLREIVRMATVYYSSRLVAEQPAGRVPRFTRARGEPLDALEVSLDLDPAPWQVLESEAERQGVSLDRLVEHATLYFLAELHAGRVVEEILRRSDADDLT